VSRSEGESAQPDLLAKEEQAVRAVVVRQTGGTDVLRIEDVDRPAPGPRDVLIRVAACGVCTLDVVTRNGTYKQRVELPIIPGHEIAGTVTEVGAEVRRFRVGNRVATTQRYHICGACRLCRGGHETLCAERRFLGQQGLVGGYAEYVAVEEDNVALVPPGVSDEQAAIAAHNMVCAPADRRPHLALPAFWSSQFGVNIKSVGVPSAADSVVITQGELAETRFERTLVVKVEPPLSRSDIARKTLHGPVIDVGA